MLPKINALKQYLRTQAGTSFTSVCVAVMWRIPPPNSSSTFDVSAIFYPVKIDDIFPKQNPEQFSVQRFNILLSMVIPVQWIDR